MGGKSRDVLAMYGNVGMVRAFCEECGTYAFVIDGEFRCCGKMAEVNPSKFKQYVPVSESTRRRTLTRSQKSKILDEQSYMCFYCERTFGSLVFRKNRRQILRPEFDHVVPFVNQKNNEIENFVAACGICNKMKSDLCFSTMDELKIYLQNRWEEKGYY